MADTALTIITDALLDLGVLSDGETPNASESIGGLRRLNNMIDGWNIEQLMVYGASANVFPLTSGKGTYTMGTGGDFNIARPNDVQSAYVRDNTLPVASQEDIPVTIFNQDEYADLPFKAWTATFPFRGIFVDWTYPLATVYVNPIPSSGQYSLVLWTQGIISNLQLNTVISLPPGYKRAMIANLVIELAAQYGQPVPQTVALIARSSKDFIKAQNTEIVELRIPSRLTGGGNFNILINGR